MVYVLKILVILRWHIHVETLHFCEGRAASNSHSVSQDRGETRLRKTLDSECLYERSKTYMHLQPSLPGPMGSVNLIRKFDVTAFQSYGF